MKGAAVIAVDTNILVYAHRQESPFHIGALNALRRLAEGSAVWALPWPCVHEFIGVVTNPRIHEHPTPLPQALRAAEEMLNAPSVLLLAEAPDYWPVLRSLVIAGNVVGARINDARIAALCLQHDVSELWSADRDFSRFPKLRVVNPLVA
jgi:toxin-antitoxin system PIN domain toxin